MKSSHQKKRKPGKGSVNCNGVLIAAVLAKARTLVVQDTKKPAVEQPAKIKDGTVLMNSAGGN
jgi:hypothetical protein